MSPIEKSSKLENVCYDIRGPVLKEAKRLEEEGNKVLKLNIGNPAPFGFDAPDEILVDVIRNLPTAQGYCDSKGLYSARKAIMQHYQARGMRDVTVEDIYIGNGVSERLGTVTVSNAEGFSATLVVEQAGAGDTSVRIEPDRISFDCNGGVKECRIITGGTGVKVSIPEEYGDWLSARLQGIVLYVDVMPMSWSGERQGEIEVANVEGGSAVLAGAKNPNQVLQNAEAADWRLDKSEIDSLLEISG